MTNVITTFSEISDNYNAVICDLWGCLHNGIESFPEALRALKKKLQREGVFREMKLKQHFEKPSVRKAREKAEAIRRARKLARKKNQRDVY